MELGRSHILLHLNHSQGRAAELQVSNCAPRAIQPASEQTERVQSTERSNLHPCSMLGWAQPALPPHHQSFQTSEDEYEAEYFLKRHRAQREAL